MLLSDAISRYLKFLKDERQASPQTLKNYQHYLQKFIDFTQDLPSDQINSEHIRRFKHHLASYIDPLSGQSLKNATQNYFLIALRSFFHYLKSHQIQIIEPSQIKLLSHQLQNLELLDDTMVSKLRQSISPTTPQTWRDKVIVELLFSTGLLVSELADLNRQDIDLDSAQVIVNGKKSRRVPFDDSSKPWLEKYLQHRTDPFMPLFIRYQGTVDLLNGGEKMRLTTRSIERIVEKYSQQAKLSVKATPQILRHYLSTRLISQGRSLETIQQTLGHQSQAITQNYTKRLNTPSPSLRDKV